jgi:hypothetical protein
MDTNPPMVAVTHHMQFVFKMKRESKLSLYEQHLTSYNASSNNNHLTSIIKQNKVDKQHNDLTSTCLTKTTLHKSTE